MILTPIKNNMNEVEVLGMKVLFSYKTPVAVIDQTGKAFKTEKKWSNTTSRHINQWLEGVEATLKPQEYFDSLFDTIDKK